MSIEAKYFSQIKTDANRYRTVSNPPRTVNRAEACVPQYTVKRYIVSLLLNVSLREFNETWQEARSQCPLPSLCFLSRLEKQDGCPQPLASDCLRHFRLLLWNCLREFKQNLIGSKISTSSTKVVFFGPIRKKRWPSRLLIGWDIFDFSCESAESAEWNSTKLDRKQDLNFLYQVFVFWLIGKTRLPPWPICQIDGTLYSAMSGARYVAFWQTSWKFLQLTRHFCTFVEI